MWGSNYTWMNLIYKKFSCRKNTKEIWLTEGDVSYYTCKYFNIQEGTWIRYSAFLVLFFVLDKGCESHVENLQSILSECTYGKFGSTRWKDSSLFSSIANGFPSFHLLMESYQQQGVVKTVLSNKFVKLHVHNYNSISYRIYLTVWCH